MSKAQYHSPLYRKLQQGAEADEYEQSLTPYEKLKEYTHVKRMMQIRAGFTAVMTMAIGVVVWMVTKNVSFVGTWLLLEYLWWSLMGGREIVYGILGSEPFGSWWFTQFILLMVILDFEVMP